MVAKQEIARLRRHIRVRRCVKGTSEKPRLCIHRSLKNTYAQIIDDQKSHTLLTISTRDKVLQGKTVTGGNIKAAETLGLECAKKALEAGITKVVFDRGGYLYHGRVKHFAEAARKGGLKF